MTSIVELIISTNDIHHKKIEDLPTDNSKMLNNVDINICILLIV